MRSANIHNVKTALDLYDSTIARIFENVKVSKDRRTNNIEVQASELNIRRAIKLYSLLNLVCLSAIGIRDKPQQEITKGLNSLIKDGGSTSLIILI